MDLADHRCYAQLRLARGLAADIRLPWQRPCPPARLAPAGSKNRRPATRHEVGKTVKRDESKKKDRRQKA